MPLDERTRTLLDEMKRSTAQMNTEATRAFEYIREVDQELEQAAPGVEAWLVLVESPGALGFGKQVAKGVFIGVRIGRAQKRRNALLLGYSKVGTKWGLALGEGRFEVDADDRVVLSADDITERKFLRDADRATKILAVPRIPRLLELLTAEIARAAAEAQNVLDRNV